MKYRLEGNNLILTTATSEITLTGAEIQEVSNFYDREVYYREDVELEIANSVETGDLPKEAQTNTEYINAVLEIYARNRIENEGTDLCMSWQDALYDAFNEIEYEDYI